MRTPGDLGLPPRRWWRVLPVTIRVVLVILAALVIVFLFPGVGSVVFPVVVVGTIVAVVVTWKRRQRAEWERRIQTLSGLLSLTPSQFEQAVRDILAGLGWKVTVTGGPGDLGADIKGRNHNGESVVVQAKQYDDEARVGAPVVQALIGARTIHRVARAMLITTATFTAPALRLARSQGIDLVDRDQLVDLAHQSLSRSNTAPAAPGWYPDPHLPDEMRWWNGSHWTGWTSSTWSQHLRREAPAPGEKPRANHTVHIDPKPAAPKAPTSSLSPIHTSPNISHSRRESSPASEPVDQPLATPAAPNPGPGPSAQTGTSPSKHEGKTHSHRAPKVGQYGFTPDFEALIGPEKAHELLERLEAASNGGDGAEPDQRSHPEAGKGTDAADSY